MLVDYLPHLMLFTLIAFLFTGFPVAGILAGIGVGFALLGTAIGEYPIAALFLIPYKIYGTIGESLIYPAVPMLLFMGVTLEVSGAARELLVCLQRVVGRLPGSMCISVLLIGFLLAPTAGVVGASVATIAMVAMPTMLNHGYRPETASGAIAAAGTLGVIAPPAIMLFFLSDALELTIGSMFLAPITPLLCLLFLFVCYFAFSEIFFEKRTTPPPLETRDGPLWVYLVRSLILPVGLIVLVLGSIIAGWVSPTESAAVGAGGGAVLLFLYRGFDIKLFGKALYRTTIITGMVFFVVLSAGIFSLVFRYYGGDDIALGLFERLGFSDFGVLLTILTILFVLGFFIDWIEITLVSLPIFLPAIAALDFSEYVGSPYLTKLWIGALIALILQTSFLTPPFGFALFFLKGSAPKEVRIAEIYRGVMPLVVIQIAMIATVLFFPAVVTALPISVLDLID